MHALSRTVILLAIATTANAQIPRPIVPPLFPAAHAAKRLFDDDNRSGPRVGVAYLIGGSVTAENEGKHFTPLTTLFGWQIERQFASGVTNAPVPMTEVVGLVGGLEQGLFLPSLSWMVGVRQQHGWEAAVGPTVTGAGVQLAIAGGVTRTVGRLNFPVNLAVAPGRRGASVSVTTGFNIGPE